MSTFLGISLPIVFGEGLIAETLAAGHAHALQFCVGGVGSWQQQPLLQGEAVEVGTDVLDAETAAEPDQFLMELQGGGIVERGVDEMAKL